MNTKVTGVRTRPDGFPKFKAHLATMQTFLIVWSGQMVSLTGSSMTGFALGVWIFQQTGSATNFALTLLFNMPPRASFASHLPWEIGLKIGRYAFTGPW
jgi:hypothetical protein